MFAGAHMSMKKTAARFLFALSLALAHGCVEEPAALRVRVFTDVPEALAHYTGWVPITFGLPFSEGRLPIDRAVRLSQVQGDAEHALQVQTRITATWEERTSVKWLLVDALVEVRDGEVAPLFLEVGDGVEAAPRESFRWDAGFAARLAPEGSEPFGPLPGDVVGRVSLAMPATDASGLPRRFVAEESYAQIETDGPVRTVLKAEGNYEGEAGERVGRFVTRLTLFSGQPYARLYHTIVWGRDDVDGAPPADELDFDYDVAPLELAYEVPGVDPSTCPSVGVGLAGGARHEAGACAPWGVAQRGLDEVVFVDDGRRTSQPGRLAGWMEAGSSVDPRRAFVGLRWAAEQFPTGFYVEGGVPRIKLLDADGMTWWQLSSTADTADGSTVPRFSPARPGPESPLGVSKTYEIWLWPNDDASAPPVEVKNAFTQGGVLAYADPAFVVRAGVPLPMSACDATCRARVAAGKDETPRDRVERALDLTFSFATRVTNPGPTDRPDRSRLGAFHFGDVFMDWDLARPDINYNFPGKHWMNTGTGFSSLAWFLWMRSGDRRYRDFADANARHVMDVDTQQIDRGTIGGNKIAGAQSQYQTTHGGFMVLAGEYEMFPRNAEIEGIALAYYLTGYERARDVLELRARNLEEQWLRPDSAMQNKLREITDPESMNPFGYPRGASPAATDGAQGEQTTLNNLTVLSEMFAEQYPALRDAGVAYTAGVIGMQGPGDGWFPGARANSADYGLFNAARAFPEMARAARHALARWAEHLGEVGAPGPTGKISGPRSLCASLELFDETGDERVLRRAQSRVYGQALSVLNERDVTGDGAGWRGQGIVNEHLLGHAVRDWLVVLAREDEGHPFDPVVPPAPYFFHQITDEVSYDDTTWPGRAHVLKPAGDELLMAFDFGLFDNPGVARRPVTIKTFAPSGRAVPDASRCITWRNSLFGLERLSWNDPVGSGPCAAPLPVPGESFAFDVPGAAEEAGVFRFDLSIPQVDQGISPPPILGAVSFAVDAALVRQDSNRALLLDGDDTRWSVPAAGAIALREKTTIAVRARPDGSAVERLLTQDDAYTIDLGPEGARAAFSVALDDEDTWVSTSLPLESAGGTVSLLASLHVDGRARRAHVELCGAREGTPAPVCASTTRDAASASVRASARPLEIGGAFHGALDELRVYPHVLTAEARTRFFVPERWTIHERDLSGGEAFMFDGSLDGLRGMRARSASAGDAPVYVEAGGTTRVARDAKVVYYDPSQDQRSYDPPKSSCVDDQPYPTLAACALRAPSLGLTGAFYSAPVGAAVSIKIFPYRFTRVGFVDAQQAFVPGLTAPIAVSTPEAVGPRYARLEDGGSVAGFWFPSPSIATPAFHFGFSPSLASLPERYFDAVACERNDRVARFGADGFLQVDAPSLARGGKIAFKILAAGTAGPQTLVSLPGLVVELDGDRVAVRAGAAAIDAPIPLARWASVEVDVAPMKDDRADLVVSIDGRAVASGALRLASLAGVATIGRSAPGGAAASFDGLLDDVTLVAGDASDARGDAAWALCSPAGVPGVTSFEDCPTGGGGFTLVSRSAPSVAVCP